MKKLDEREDGVQKKAQHNQDFSKVQQGKRFFIHAEETETEE